MAEDRRSASREKKRETWEEREARRLARNVYDHLAYYIQVQLPETKFVNETMTQRYAPTRQPTTPKLRQTVREKPNIKERANSCRMKSTGRRSVTGNRKETTNKSSTKNSNSHAPKNISSETSSTESEDERKVKKNGVKRSETRSTPSTPSRKPTYSSRPYSSRPPSRRREDLNESQRGSPYTVDQSAKDMGRTSTAKIMRMEAERVAANATNIIKTLSLNEVVAIQRYRSPAKSSLRCSSSLSEHPHGMLRSDKALEYAVKHNERESARNYMTEKKQKMKLKEKKKKERQKSQLTSTQSYQRKYKAPLTPIACYQSDETSSSSSDESKSPSTTSMSSRSSASTIRKVENVHTRSSSASSKNSTKQSKIRSGRNKKKHTKSTTRYVKADESKPSISENVSSTSNGSSEDEEAGAKRSDTESDNTSDDGVTDANEYQLSQKDEAENSHPEDVSTKSRSSSESSMEGSALLQENFESASANERSSADDVAKKMARGLSKNHTDSSAISGSSSDEDAAVISNADRNNETSVGLLNNASKTNPDSRILEKLINYTSDTSNTSGTTTERASNSQGEETYSGNIGRASDERKGERSSTRSSSSNIHKAISVSEEMQSTRRKNSSNAEAFESQRRKASRSMAQSPSESDNFDVSSMTSSLRRLIEEAEITVSESSSSSSSEDSSSHERIPVEERIFGRSIPDLRQAHATSNGGGQYLESGGEVLGDSPAKSQFM